MEIEADKYYRLYLGGEVIGTSFQNLTNALEFGNKHRELCNDCQNKPLKIEVVKVVTLTDIVYDETDVKDVQ